MVTWQNRIMIRYTILVLIFFHSVAMAAMSEGEAIQKVQSKYPGKVLSTQEVKTPQGVKFKIKILSDGTIRTVTVDAETGQLSLE